jgi:hypothetical protein
MNFGAYYMKSNPFKAMKKNVTFIIWLLSLIFVYYIAFKYG